MWLSLQAADMQNLTRIFQWKNLNFPSLRSWHVWVNPCPYCNSAGLNKYVFFHISLTGLQPKVLPLYFYRNCFKRNELKGPNTMSWSSLPKLELCIIFIREKPDSLYPPNKRVKRRQKNSGKLALWHLRNWNPQLTVNLSRNRNFCPTHAALWVKELPNWFTLVIF